MEADHRLTVSGELQSVFEVQNVTATGTIDVDGSRIALDDVGIRGDGLELRTRIRLRDGTPQGLLYLRRGAFFARPRSESGAAQVGSPRRFTEMFGAVGRDSRYAGAGRKVIGGAEAGRPAGS